MIASVVPIGATARRGDVELGVTWLLVGEDWMLVDYATSGIGSFAHLGLSDDRGTSYAPMGGGASGDHTGLLRHDAKLHGALHLQATELLLTLVEAKENGEELLQTKAWIDDRVSSTTIRSNVPSDSAPRAQASGTCLECGRPAADVACAECRAEPFRIAARRSHRLVPQRILPIPAPLMSVEGRRYSVAGLLAWEETFTLRLVFEPGPERDLVRVHQAPPFPGRWKGTDATGRTFVGRPSGWGVCESEGRVLGDATIEFIPGLHPDAGPLVLRTEAAGRTLAELELPLDGPARVING